MSRRLALFDVDGTLLTGTCERYFLRWLLARGELKASDGLRTLLRGLRHWPRDPVAALKSNKVYYRDKSVDRFESLAARFVQEELLPRLRPAMTTKIEMHRRQGEELALLSGAPDLILMPLARHLDVATAIPSPLERRDGRFTGELAGPHPWGGTKAAITRERFPAPDWDLGASFAYADHASDLELLAMFGHPVLVHPSRRLARRARRQGLTIFRP
jgi:HAD superfamily hydrolase (TIGR01490 family)